MAIPKQQRFVNFWLIRLINNYIHIELESIELESSETEPHYFFISAKIDLIQYVFPTLLV